MKKIKWHTLVLSALYIALGVFLIAAPGVTLNVLCGTIGGAVLLCGIVQLIRYFTQREGLFWAPLTLIFGIICVGVGGFLLLRSDIIISALPTVFGLFVIFDSVVRIQNALELRRCQYENWKSFLLLGVLSILLGALMIANPFGTMETLVMAIGVILTIEGALNLITSLYTGLAVRSYLKLHPELNRALEEATGQDLDGDGMVAAPVTAATVEGTARELETAPAEEPKQLPAP